jgi:hypothetical protein
MYQKFALTSGVAPQTVCGFVSVIDPQPLDQEQHIAQKQCSSRITYTWQNRVLKIKKPNE